MAEVEEVEGWLKQHQTLITIIVLAVGALAAVIYYYYSLQNQAAAAAAAAQQPQGLSPNDVLSDMGVSSSGSSSSSGATVTPPAPQTLPQITIPPVTIPTVTPTPTDTGSQVQQQDTDTFSSMYENTNTQLQNLINSIISTPTNTPPPTVTPPAATYPYPIGHATVAQMEAAGTPENLANTIVGWLGTNPSAPQSELSYYQALVAAGSPTLASQSEAENLAQTLNIPRTGAYAIPGTPEAAKPFTGV